MRFSLEKLDKIFLRATGIVVLIAAFVIIMIALFIGYQIIKDMRRSRNDVALVRVDEKTKEKVFFNLGYAQNLKGGRFIKIDLNSMGDRKAAISYSSGMNHRNINQLIVDTEKKDQFWVFEKNPGLLGYIETVTDKVGDHQGGNSLGLIIEVYEKDSNSNGQVDSDDDVKVIYYDLIKRQSSNVIERADKMVSRVQLNANEFLFLFNRDKKSHSAIYNIPAGRLENEKQVDFPN